MSSIGETLRRERLRRNLGLDQISRELKISTRFLDAIEQERFERLPAGVFAKSFVRQYARYLGLDEDDVVAEVQRILAPPATVDDPNAPVVPPVSDIRVPPMEQWQSIGDHRGIDWSSSLPSLALVVVVMLVCSGVYAFWQHNRRSETVAQVEPPPAQTLAPQQSSAPPPVSESAAAAPPAAQESAPTSRAPLQAQPAQTAPAVPAENNSADREPIAPKTDPAHPANSHHPVRVELTAEEPVWVLAQADGKYLFSGTLEPNQTRAVEASEKLTLRLGDAGGVSITLNGKPIGSIGRKGQVRDIQFTSGGFQIVGAPKPSLPLNNPI
jgi:cytoskeleton protein RodZ